MRYARAGGPAPVSSAHVLLALFAEPEGVAARVLRTMNVGEESVRAAIGIAAREAGAAGAGAGPTDDGAVGGAEIARAAARDFTRDGQQALRDALAVALELVHNYIGTEHLLIGLYRNPESPAAVILAEAGTTEAQALAHVQEMLRRYRPPAAR
jgi:ATP-dependent Clp protease ATP-binding subunit ClpA